jgi:hypothetical protein
MAGVYLLAGIFLLVKGWYILSPWQNVGAGILFVIYAAFRGYRAYSEEEKSKSEGSETSIENPA